MKKKRIKAIKPGKLGGPPRRSRCAVSVTRTLDNGSFRDRSDPSRVVLAIGDTQFPFAHPDYLEFLAAVNDRYQPTDHVHIGDTCDFHGLSNFEHDPDGLSAGHEYKRAMENMQDLYAMFPVMKVCLSNHDARPFRKAYSAGIPKEFIKSYAEFMKSPPGWEWAQKFEIDGIIYEHGEGMAGEFAHKKAAAMNMQSTVIGHLHANAGIEWLASPRCLVFGFALGCLVDNDAYAFAYGKHMKRKPILGCGVIDKGIPSFIPMLLAKGGKWVGRL